jgi:hypothetical protein
MDNAVSAFESSPVVFGPRFTNPELPSIPECVFQWVLEDGTVVPVYGKESFWFVDVWGPLGLS